MDGVAMGSLLGPLMANTFMCNIEKQLETRNKMLAFYKRYVDDTLSTMPDAETASEFLITLNNSHLFITFIMELKENGGLSFLGMDIIRNGCRLDTKIRNLQTQSADNLEASVYTSRKIKDEIKVREDKPPLVNQQCVVYNFQCNLCDVGYVGYTCRHLHQRIEEHKGRSLVITSRSNTVWPQIR
ncbi:hypothetical protein ACROYT_G002107 [Oculina patagonica]